MNEYWTLPMSRFQWEMGKEWRNKIAVDFSMEEKRCSHKEGTNKLSYSTVLAKAASPLKFIPICQAFPLSPSSMLWLRWNFLEQGAQPRSWPIRKVIEMGKAYWVEDGNYWLWRDCRSHLKDDQITANRKYLQANQNPAGWLHWALGSSRFLFLS